MKPLSVGNVVSAGLRIYRDNFKKYYRLAFIGSLWLWIPIYVIDKFYAYQALIIGLLLVWIPIYGTAKFYAHQALISRLAYGEIIEQPETVRDANRHVKGRMWSLLLAAILVYLRFLLAYILGALAIILVVGGLTTVINWTLSFILGDNGGIIGTILSIILSVAVLVVFFGYLIRLFASFSVSELVLATEENINASQSLKRSQELTKSYLQNLILIYLISSLVSFPLLGLIFTLQVLPTFLQDSNLAAYTGIFTIFQLIFNSLTTALILPFWQSIKAVIYYDLKVRREGMGLNLRK